MPISIYQKQRIQDLKERALELQKTGMTMKQIGVVIGKSPAWICLAIKELRNVEKSDSKTIQ